jgi:hypothetical protein
MMRGCARTIGVIVAIMVVLVVIGSLLPEQHVTSDGRQSIVDLSKPVYLAKDAVECSTLAAAFTYSRGQQAGGEAQGRRAVANLFVHPTDDCYRTPRRERVRVLDATIGDHAYVKTKCILSLLGRSDGWGDPNEDGCAISCRSNLIGEKMK